MPYLITTSIYPTHKSNEVAEKYLEAVETYPPDEDLGRQIIPAAVKSTEKGIRVISVIDVKEGKLEEALSHQAKFMKPFLSIQGYNYTSDINLTVNESLALWR